MRAIAGVVRVQKSADTQSCYLPQAVQEDLALDTRDLLVFYKPPSQTEWQFSKITASQLDMLIAAQKTGIDVTRVDVPRFLEAAVPCHEEESV